MATKISLENIFQKIKLKRQKNGRQKENIIQLEELMQEVQCQISQSFQIENRENDIDN